MTLLYTIRTIVGVVGNVIACGLFLSPAPTIWRIYRKKDTESFSGVAYVATLFNCMLWVLYGLPFVTLHSTLIITINSIGFVVESVYLGIYLAYAPKPTRNMIFRMLAIVVTVFAIVVAVTLRVTGVHQTRRIIVGVCCVFVATLMYAAPLSVMRLVIVSKSVEYMPLLPSAAAFLNGAVWTTYGFLGKIDFFIVVPNLLGTLLAIAQLILYGFYYKALPETKNCGKPSVKPVLPVSTV